MLSWIIRNTIKRPVAVIMLTFLVLLFGALSFTSLSTNFYPVIKVPKLTVATSYPGLPAKEVLDLLTIPIEDGLSSIQGLKSIKSSSLDGLSLIELSFSWGTDMTQTGVNARELADLAALRLPDGAQKPMVLPVNPAERPILIIGVFPKESMTISDLKKLCDREIKTHLQQADGVGYIQILGGLDEEILIEPNIEKLSAFGLTLQQLSQIIQSTNIEMPAGSIEQGSMEYVLKTDATAKNIQDIGQIRINAQANASHQNSSILLKDIAEISNSTNERTSFMSQNGKEGIALLVRVQNGYSPVSLSKNIAKKLPDLRRAYGKTLDLRILQDSSVLIVDSIKDLIVSSLFGFIIAFIVIFLYMHDMRSSLIMIMSIPLSLIMTIAVFPLFHVSINTMSIGGLAIGIGMLVDDSVVVLENIQRKSEAFNRESVTLATLEIANSTIGSTFTSLIVFIPLFFLPGILGAVFTDLAWAVCLSILFSFIVSVTVVPVLYCKFGTSGQAKVKTGAMYRKTLRFFLRKPTSLFVISGVLLTLGLFCLINIEKDWLSTPASDEYTVKIAFPSGTRADYMLKTADTMSPILESSGIIKTCFFYGGGDQADPYYVSSKSPESETLNCEISLAENVAISERELKKIIAGYFSDIATDDIEINPAALSYNEVLGISDGKMTILGITGKDYEDAYRKGTELIDSTSIKQGKLYPNPTRLKITANPDWDAINRISSDAASIADILGSSIYGIYSGSIESKDGRIPIRIRLPESRRSSIDQIRSILFTNASGTTSALSEVINFSESKNPPVFYRTERQNTVYLQVPSDEWETLRTVRENLVNTDAKDWDELMKGVYLLFMISVFLMYVFLGIQFNSFALPVLLMGIIPFGFAGVFIALFFMRSSMNLNGILGSLIVIGIIVRNGIIFYDHYTAIIKTKASIPVYIYTGANDRIRAISISFLTTLLALLPIALDMSGKNTQKTMAIAIIGGLVFSNFLSLYLFPVIFKRYFERKLTE